METFTALLDAIVERLEDHWIKILTGMAFMAVGWFFGKRRAQKNWEKKEFLDRLNVSLTRITDGTLQIRTLLEKSAADIFLNSVAVGGVMAAAQKTTPEDPILPLPKDDYWYYLNSVLNEIAEHFATGQIRRDLGQNVECGRYLITLTNECDGAVRTRKVRAMVVRRELLENLPEEDPKFESPNHKTRWKTLKQISESWKNDPHRFIDVEICI